ncbi:glycoside hydrolase [Neoconidiobolus thromboides FSU 785]|nr:glycoside hydrolase [Neoconidiobolus thromboides FSU 785]
MMGYFHTQSQTPIEARINVTNVSPRLTHTIYAFAVVHGERAECVVQDLFYDTQDQTALPLVKLGNNGNSSCNSDARGNGNYGALFGLKKDNPHMRILMSVGGASDISKKNFTMATSSKDRINNLAKSCVKLALDYGMDGIDYDWEYPTNSKEWDNFNNLLTQTRNELNNYQYSKRYLISVALLPSAFKTNDTKSIMPKLANQVDFINLMTYDASPGSDRALHNSPLFTTSESYGAMSINDTVTEALKYFPNNKIIIGQPLYGIMVKTQATTTNNGSNEIDRGLFQKAKQIPKAANSTSNQQFEPIFYNTIKEKYLTNDNFTRYWDDTSKATWLYNNQTNEFLTYSDEISIKEVLDYIELKDLAGIFFWQLGGSFNKQSYKEELIEFTASQTKIDYKKRAVCAPQAAFCNIRSDCPKDMLEDGTLPTNSKGYSLSVMNIWILISLLILKENLL